MEKAQHVLASIFLILQPNTKESVASATLQYSASATPNLPAIEPAFTPRVILLTIDSMRLVMVFLIGSVWLSAYAQNQALFPYQQGELWGYADSAGNIVLEPIYQAAGPMEYGRAVVQLPTSPDYLAIDEQGNYLSSECLGRLPHFPIAEGYASGYYPEHHFRDSLLYSKDHRLVAFLEAYPVSYRMNSYGNHVFPNTPSGKLFGIYQDRFVLSKNPSSDRWSYLMVDPGSDKIYFLDKGEWVDTRLKYLAYCYLRDTFKTYSYERDREVHYSTFPFQEVKPRNVPKKLHSWNYKGLWKVGNTSTRKVRSFRNKTFIHPSFGPGLMAEKRRKESCRYFFIDEDLKIRKLPFSDSVSHLGYGLFNIGLHMDRYLVNLKGDTLLKGEAVLGTSNPWYALVSVGDSTYTLLHDGGKWNVAKAHRHAPEAKHQGKGLMFEYSGRYRGGISVYQKNLNGSIIANQVSGGKKLEVLAIPDRLFAIHYLEDEQGGYYIINLLDNNFSTLVTVKSEYEPTEIEYVKVGVFRFRSGYNHYYFNKEGVCFWTSE